MQTELTQEFNETAAAAYAAFPEALRDLVVLFVPSSKMPVFASPEIAEQLTKKVADVKAAVGGAANYISSGNASGFSEKDYDLAGTAVNLIAFSDNIRGIFSERYKKEMRAVYYLNHEIGHHILEDGYPVSRLGNLSSDILLRQLAESVADAFAMLRHIQIFGMDTDQAGGYGGSRASLIISCADAIPYTSDVVERVFRYAEKNDISGLSLQDTAVLAEKIAAECKFERGTLQAILDAYRPVHQACKRFGSAREITEKLYGENKEAYLLFCRETLAVMKNHQDDPDVFGAGKHFLNFPAIKKFMTGLAEVDSCWTEHLNFINNHKPNVAAKRPSRAVSIPVLIL